MGLSEGFSKAAFVAEHDRDALSRQLADALELEVQRLLHEAIKPVLARIVDDLNLRGHRLKNYEHPRPGLIALRDDSLDGHDYRCDLRLAVDTIVSVGFRDTIEYASENESESDSSGN